MGSQCKTTGTTGTAKGNTQVACQAFKIIDYAGQNEAGDLPPEKVDTKGTIKQAQEHNASYESVCPS